MKKTLSRRLYLLCIKLIKLLLRHLPDQREILKRSDGREVLYALNPMDQNNLLKILLRKGSETKLSDMSHEELDRLIETRSLEAKFQRS